MSNADTLKRPVDADRIARVRGSLKMLETKLGETHARIVSDAEQLIYDLIPSPQTNVVGVIEALRAAEPYVELCHSLMSEKETRAQVWKVLKQVRAALTTEGQP